MSKISKVANIAYGTLEVGFGMTIALVGDFFAGGFVVFDGARRLWDATPQRFQKFVTGKEPAAKVTGPKSVLHHTTDIIASSFALVIGLKMSVLGGIAALAGIGGTVVTGSLAPLLLGLPLFAAGALAVGGAVSLTRRVSAAIGDYKASSKAVATKTAALAAVVEAPAVASKEAAPAFNNSSEPKADSAPEKPAPAPVINPPTL